MNTLAPTGHHADGSSIQKHSAGPLYPLVIVGKEGLGHTLWGVMGPDGADPQLWYFKAADAVSEAEDILAHLATLRASQRKPARRAEALYGVLEPVVTPREQCITNVERYDALLDAMEVAPNGDDYNAILGMMRGRPFEPPLPHSQR